MSCTRVIHESREMRDISRCFWKLSDQCPISFLGLCSITIIHSFSSPSLAPLVAVSHPLSKHSDQLEVFLSCLLSILFISHALTTVPPLSSSVSRVSLVAIIFLLLIIALSSHNLSLTQFSVPPLSRSRLHKRTPHLHESLRLVSGQHLQTKHLGQLDCTCGEKRLSSSLSLSILDQLAPPVLSYGFLVAIYCSLSRYLENETRSTVIVSPLLLYHPPPVPLIVIDDSRLPFTTHASYHLSVDHDLSLFIIILCSLTVILTPLLVPHFSSIITAFAKTSNQNIQFNSMRKHHALFPSSFFFLFLFLFSHSSLSSNFLLTLTHSLLIFPPHFKPFKKKFPINQ